MNTPTFQLCDRVILKQTSKINGFQLNDDPKYNPDVEGTVISTHNKKMFPLPYIVLWDNGFKNSYDETNLKKITL